MKRNASPNVIKKHFSCVAFFLVLLSTFIVRVINNSETTQNIALVLLIISGSAGILWLYHDRRVSVLLYILIASIGWLFTYLLRTSWTYDFVFYINSIMYMGTAYLLFRFSHDERIYKAFYYIVAIYIIYMIRIRGVPIRGFMKDGTSYNYISVITLLFLDVYSIIQIKNGKSLSYFDAFAYLAVTIFAYGRGGIVTAGSFLICTSLGKIVENRKSYKTHLLLIFCVFAIYIFRESIVSYIFGAGYLAKFQLYQFETGRTQIWSTFWRECFSSLPNFLTGAKPNTLVSNGNLHNSFFQMYTCFGIVFFAVNVYLIVASVIHCIRTKQYWLLLIFITFFIRAFLDRLMYRGYMEIIYYYYIFNYLLTKKVVKKKRGYYGSLFQLKESAGI